VNAKTSPDSISVAFITRPPQTGKTRAVKQLTVDFYVVTAAQAGVIQLRKLFSRRPRESARVCTHLIGWVVSVTLGREKSSGLMRIPVVPAKAGTQDFSRLPWVPACAGTTRLAYPENTPDGLFRGRPRTHRDVCIP
jgi:hypothetical protein